MTAQDPACLLRMREHRAFEPLVQPDENYPTIMIDVDKTFQTIEGFGGAFTDATAITFAKLPKEEQAKFLKLCFDPEEGNGYTRSAGPRSIAATIRRKCTPMTR
jgi:glucosylceramidase